MYQRVTKQTKVFWFFFSKKHCFLGGAAHQPQSLAHPAADVPLGSSVMPSDNAATAWRRGHFANRTGDIRNHIARVPPVAGPLAHSAIDMQQKLCCGFHGQRMRETMIYANY